jgi:hypothetical protein
MDKDIRMGKHMLLLHFYVQAAYPCMYMLHDHFHAASHVHAAGSYPSIMDMNTQQED